MDSVLYSFKEIREILPHDFPLLLIDKVTECVPGEKLTAIKLISGSDPVLQGHFPKMAIYPGIYLIECIAQAASILGQKTLEDFKIADNGVTVNLLSSIKSVRFRAPVFPGDVLTIKVNIVRKKLSLVFVEGQIYRDDQKICDCELTCAIVSWEKFGDSL